MDGAEAIYEADEYAFQKGRESPACTVGVSAHVWYLGEIPELLS